MPPQATLAPAVALLLLALTACSGGSPGNTSLTVLADTSLSEVGRELGAAYQLSHPEITIKFRYDGSLELADGVKHGQKADAIITDDAQSLQDIRKHVGERTIVARNSLTIAVTPGNPKRIRGLESLSLPRIRVVIGAPLVPVGAYAEAALRKAGVTVRPVSQESDARMVLNQVRTGEADAGIVYITDMKSAGAAASSVPVPAAQNVQAAFPAAVVAKSPHEKAAASFVAWLASADATAVFAKYGFQAP
ncbi:MAG: molybdate ABC transporter substrate-binding protein [Streptosporangiaceae bacterium]